MDEESAQLFVRERCSGLKEDERGLIKTVLRQLPTGVDLSRLRGVHTVYLGLAFQCSHSDWHLFLDWNLLNKASKMSENKAIEQRRAMGAIALNLAHYALGHGIDTIHGEDAYKSARRLVSSWGLGEEIAEMEKAYL